MNWTLFATKTLNLFTSFLMYPNTTLLSVEQNSLIGVYIVSSFFRSRETFIDNATTVNSNLGIETNFSGVTLDLAITRLE